jgi:hypothetical protein
LSLLLRDHRLEGEVLHVVVEQDHRHEGFGYWPTRAALAEGGYEVDGARQMGRKPGDGERLIATLAGLALSPVRKLP